jgi:hypothetical protein
MDQLPLFGKLHAALWGWNISWLPFGPEPSVFSVAVEKLENWNIQDYNFACGSVWV